MPQGPLKLYVNKSFIVPGMSYTALLHPFMGVGAVKDNFIYLESTLKHNFDSHYFTLVDSLQEAEYVLVPHDYWKLKAARPDLLERMVEEARQHDKPLLIDASGDVSGVVSVGYDRVRVLRINQYRFELPAYEVKVPVPCEDLLETYCNNEIQVRHKSEIATVGFVGWGRMSLKQRLRSLLKEVPVRIHAIVDRRYVTKYKGVFWREKANAIFEASKRIKANFIIRSSYSGNVHTLAGDKEKNRREFVDNILGSDYTLVVKGDANEATRFYEVLSLGRIPVLIDTAVVLPLENLINYRECAVIIDHTDLARAPEILADFHAKLTDGEFLAMQRKARYIFETFLRLDAFSKYLVETLRTEAPHHIV